MSLSTFMNDWPFSSHFTFWLISSNGTRRDEGTLIVFFFFKNTAKMFELWEKTYSTLITIVNQEKN